jgi:hypothetical protein
MKRIIFKSAAFLMLIASIASCSTESAVDLTNDASAEVPERESRSSIWDDVIGQDMGNDVYEITADKAAIIDELQDIADKEGDSSELVTLDILKKPVINDPNDSGFMLVAASRTGLSIGVVVAKTSGGFFRLDPSFGHKTVSCRGCASGCNLQYLNIDGKKVPICNENGCVADCTKTETTF